MAGDWLKVRHDLLEDESTIGISIAMGIDVEWVAGKLIRVWKWADLNTEDGQVRFANLSFLDNLVRMEGFGKAMVDVGWLQEFKGGLLFPNFKRHNGKSAKVRLVEAQKKCNQRKGDKIGTNVPPRKGQKPDECPSPSYSSLTLNSSSNSSSEEPLKFNPLDPPEFAREQLEPVWQRLLAIWSNGGAQRKDPLRPNRIQRLKDALNVYTEDEIYAGWEWLRKSPRAENHRNGGASIDTFLDKIDKYVSLSKEVNAFDAPTRTPIREQQEHDPVAEYFKRGAK